MVSFIFSGIFWGTILILFGVFAIINVLFHLHIPLFRFFFAFLLIYWGISMLVSRKYSEDKTIYIEEEKTEFHHHGRHQEYNMVFGSRTIDLSDLRVDEKTVLKINVVFGSATVLLSKETPALIVAQSAFGSTHLPDGTQLSFGKHVLRTPSYRTTEPHVNIESNSVFGSVRFVYKD